MRRQKELAAQMGIDVAWNCAISLRPLDGEDDPHRMVSDYADWDVNAKVSYGMLSVGCSKESVRCNTSSSFQPRSCHTGLTTSESTCRKLIMFRCLLACSLM
jgi:hypothetical protein